MKKILGLSTLALAGVLAFTGCSCGKDEGNAETYTGAYVDTNYGIALSVEVEDGKIVSVKAASEEAVGKTNASVTNNWDRTKWTSAETEFLNGFVGKTVEEVKAITVTPSGWNFSVDGYDVVTGATASSARAILALQDALADYDLFH